MYRNSACVVWWLLNWQIMSQPKRHNFKILLQTTNNVTSDEILGKIESRFVKTRQFLFSLEMYSSMPTIEAKEHRRLRGRQTVSPSSLGLWILNNMSSLHKCYNFNLNTLKHLNRMVRELVCIFISVKKA